MKYYKVSVKNFRKLEEELLIDNKYNVVVCWYMEKLYSLMDSFTSWKKLLRFTILYELIFILLSTITYYVVYVLILRSKFHYLSSEPINEIKKYKFMKVDYIYVCVKNNKMYYEYIEVENKYPIDYDEILLRKNKINKLL